MIHVLAIITAKPGKRAEVLAAFHGIVPAVRKEEGCIEYGAAVDAEGLGSSQARLGPDTYAVVEKWASTAALSAHTKAPHLVEFRDKTKDLIASRVVHVLSPT
jgi:quinol monooxygenase YgiN